MGREESSANDAEGLGAMPLGTICEAAGVNESLVHHLYEEVVNDDPETVGLRAAVMGVAASADQQEQQDHPQHLVAVAEAELEAAYVTAAEQEQQQVEEEAAAAASASGHEESTPLLHHILPSNIAAPTTEPPSPPRRRRHIRDVSEDFAAQALQAIHAPDAQEDAAEKGDNMPNAAGGLPPKPVYQHAHPLVPPSGAPSAKARPHRRSLSAFAYGSGQKTSAAEYRANLLGNLMHRNDSFKVAKPKPPSTAAAGTSLRNLLAPSESFRKVNLPADGIPQPTRARIGTWDNPSMPSIPQDTAASHHRAAFVILEATSDAPPRGHGRHRRMHTAIGGGVEMTAGATLAPPHPPAADTHGHGHRRGHSLLPDALMAPLERGLSILPSIPTSLPSDVDEVNLTIDVKEGPKGETEDVDVLLVVKRSVPTIGYVLLVMACFCLSTTGAVLDKQEGVSPTLKAYWRMSATWLCLFPFALRSVLGHGGGIPKLSRYEWSLFLWCGLGYAVCAEFFVLALSLAPVMNVYIFANTHCLLFVVLKVVTGAPIACKEGFGAVIGFIGGVICAMGGKSGDSDGVGTSDTHDRFLGAASETGGVELPSYVGDLVALMSACGTVLYLSVAKRLRPRCDVRFYIFMQFFVASWWLLSMMIISGEHFILSSDPHIGLWGWVTPRLDRLGIEVWLVFICNVGGVFGYIAAMKYFEPLVISCCQNVNPILSSIFSVMLGVDPPPTPLALIGDSIVFGGTYMVISSGSKKTEITDVKEVARERGYTATGHVDDKEK